MVLRIFAVLIFVVSFVAVFVPATQAQNNVQDLINKPMPTFDPMPMEEFEAASIKIEDVPLGDAYLAYEIRLPKTWERSKGQGVSGFSLSKKILADVGRYYGPPVMTSRSSLAIKATERVYQSTAEQWFVNYILENGYTMQGMNIISPERAEGVYIVVDGDVTFVVRSVVITNGKRVIVADYKLPFTEWQNEKALQARVLESFKLKKKDDSLVEEMKQSQFLDIAEMQYPASWQFQTSAVRSIDRLDAELLNVLQRIDGRSKVQVLNGKIDVELISSFIVDDLEKETQDYKQRDEKEGLALGKLIEEPEDIEIDESMEFAYTEVYEAFDANKPNVKYEYWFTIMAAKDYYFFTSLLTPARNQDYANWARNTQSYFLVNRFLKPQETMSSKGK